MKTQTLRIAVAAPWGAVVGVLVGLLVSPENPPRPPLQHKVWHINNENGTPVHPVRSLDLPVRFGDFDLNCVVELATDAELDLVFRKVEHWGETDLPLFHARFGVLRMSSRMEGPGFLTREQALFSQSPGGILIAPGEPGASLSLQCRGRVVQATINGIELPTLTLPDGFGNMAFVAHGGPALIREFHITPWQLAAVRPVWQWAGLTGGLLGLLLALLGASLPRVLVGLSSGLLGAGAGQLFLVYPLLPAVRAEAEAVYFTAICCLPLALSIGLPMRRRVGRIAMVLVVGVGGYLACLEGAARVELPRFAAMQDDRLDLYFGPESGSATFDAVSRMLRCEFRAHTLLVERHDVLLLGGKQFFDYHEPGKVDKNVGARLPGLLKHRLGRSREQTVEVAAVPTELSHVYQQYLLFRDFYRDYRPRVVVLGVTAEEAEAMLPLPARQLAAAAALATPPASALSGLIARAARPRVELQSPEDLGKTLAELAQLCRECDSMLVLVSDAKLPPRYLAVLREFAETGAVPVVEGFDLGAGVYPVERLADLVAGLLSR